MSLEQENAELYEMVLKQASTIQEYQSQRHIKFPKLTDEVIADLWHQSGGHLYKFAKILRDWLEQNATNN